MILEGMKKYKIKEAMLTLTYMRRMRLITKEKTDEYCNGKEVQKESVNEDLESLIADIRLGKEPDSMLETYVLPKLMERELELVEKQNHDFMDTFLMMMDADVNKAEMMLSESNSKFVISICRRKTSTLKTFKKSQNFICFK